MLYLFAMPLQFYFLCLIFESICNTFVDPGFGVFSPSKDELIIQTPVISLPTDLKQHVFFLFLKSTY